MQTRIIAKTVDEEYWLIINTFKMSVVFHAIVSVYNWFPLSSSSLQSIQEIKKWTSWLTYFNHYFRLLCTMRCTQGSSLYWMQIICSAKNFKLNYLFYSQMLIIIINIFFVFFHILFPDLLLMCVRPMPVRIIWLDLTLQLLLYKFGVIIHYFYCSLCECRNHDKWIWDFCTFLITRTIRLATTTTIPTADINW